MFQMGAYIKEVQFFRILTVIGHGVPVGPLGGGGPSLQDTVHLTPFISLYS